MEPLSFDGRVAIITGGGGGLGRSHALELARRGALVVINDLGGAVDGTGSSTSAAQVVVDEIKSRGGEAVANHDSVATAEGGEAIVAAAVDAFGKVDIIINNAGILRDASFKNTTPEMLDPVLDVHLRGAFNVTRPAWPIMKEQGYGRIVNTASGAGLFGNFGQSNYGAAKMGLVGMARVLGVEGFKSNIRANVIAPVARTRMTEELLGEIAEKLDPELITPVVAFLAHESCDFSGRIFSVGGGRVSEIFLGATPGIVDPALTAETVAERFDEITDTEGFIVPRKLGDEIKLLHQALS
jgi:NAD(P)-dependent dehydrogenase (short-subunit alcohol dehydrogenase family)